MSLVLAELRLLLRSRLALASLALLLALSALAIVSGLSTVARQREDIARVTAAQARDFAAIVDEQGRPDGDAGDAAYYTFLLTHDSPPPLAFAAVGQRDLHPHVLRVRALGLQQQLHDAEAVNAELALPGVFDWAFMLIYLAPLVVIALSHDLVSSEREGGRLRLLLSLPGSGLWRRRIGLRYLFVLLAVTAPLLLALPAAGGSALAGAGMIAVAAVYLGFWFGLGLLAAVGARASTTAAAALLGCWVALTLLLPTLTNAAIARTVPVGKGIDLTLVQREAVHHGWDIPKRDTFDRFFAAHPEWRGKEAFDGRFHWKWYFAMHQVGDEAVAADARSYRASLLARERWTERLGWLLPPVAAQGLLHRLADTDRVAQLSYQDAVAAFHGRLRHFFYPYLFADRPFTRADFALLPRFSPRPGTMTWPAGPMTALILAAGAVLLAGAARLRRL